MSPKQRSIALLGATGSVGKNVLDVILGAPERFRLEVLSCGTRAEELSELAREIGACDTYCAQQPEKSTFHSEDALLDVLQSDRIDTVICAIQGAEPALRCVMTALRAGKRVCLASKEVLVAAGSWVTRTAQETGAELLPVDSEHCALFQCLNGDAPQSRQSLRKLWLTCSGGPFHAHPEIDLHRVTPADALRHPTWKMGSKITLDCATLMNKAFEMIEAAWLFGVPEEQIGVLVHPQSIIHSMVEFQDGAVIAQLGPTDMRLPIRYCLDYPERQPAPNQHLDFTSRLDFQLLPPDTKRFPALELARHVLRKGGAAGALLQAANDFALRRFLNGTLAFDEIVPAVANAVECAPKTAPESLEEIREAYRLAQNAVERFHGTRCSNL